MPSMNPQLISHLAAAIHDATYRPFSLRVCTPIGGGSINSAYRLEGTDGTQYFLKTNHAQHLARFVAELAGLDAIRATHTLRVPQPIVHGSVAGQCYLVLEYLELSANGNANFLGERLAALHRCTASNFGYAQANYLGTTPQSNQWSASWIDFWCEQRLGYQLKLAEKNGYGGQLQRLGEKLMHVLATFFTDYTPQPSLLHGDLWGGNHAFLPDGTPAVFDPAVYYGDREADLAMTELFGGYPANFYAAYRAAYPLDPGYTMRRDLYNLYHILNHANLFGGGYAQQAEQMMLKLLEQEKNIK